jgi:hypothetical protein
MICWPRRPGGAAGPAVWRGRRSAPERRGLIQRGPKYLDLADGRSQLHRQPHRPALPSSARRRVIRCQRPSGAAAQRVPTIATSRPGSTGRSTGAPSTRATGAGGPGSGPAPLEPNSACTSGEAGYPGLVNSRFSTSHRDWPVDRYSPASTSPGVDRKPRERGPQIGRHLVLPPDTAPPAEPQRIPRSRLHRPSPSDRPGHQIGTLSIHCCRGPSRWHPGCQ